MGEAGSKPIERDRGGKEGGEEEEEEKEKDRRVRRGRVNAKLRGR